MLFFQAPLLWPEVRQITMAESLASKQSFSTHGDQGNVDLGNLQTDGFCVALALHAFLPVDLGNLQTDGFCVALALHAFLPGSIAVA
ncbi:uncharacterized protein LOC144366055 isoform X3 [Ictidomys tridecemlineatus]